MTDITNMDMFTETPISMDKDTIKEYWAYMLSKFFITRSDYEYNITMLEPLENFILEGVNREEAYNNLLAYEKTFRDQTSAILEISFELFCKELDKGYGKANFVQIARLFEDSNGRIWYDNEFV